MTKLLLSFLIPLCAVQAVNAENSIFAGGDGSQAAPWQISNSEQITKMAEVLEHGKFTYFELAADIDMSGIQWTPLNYEGPYDLGIIFDGKGYTIENLTVNTEVYPSFFGVLYGECRNVFFKDASITQNYGYCAGIITSYAGTGGKPALIERCKVSGVITTTSVSAPQTGGIAGIAREGKILDCYADVTLRREKTKANVGIGGIVGLVREKGHVENCYATGSVDAIRWDNAGGVYGRANDNCGWTIKNNIGAMSSVIGAWASNRVGGRTIKKTGGNILGTNYGWTGTQLIVYKDSDENPCKPYDIDNQGNENDRTEKGIDTDNVTDAAKALGWNPEIWDFSTAMPTLQWEKRQQSGIENIRIEDTIDTAPIYYNLGGMRVEAPVKGQLYIMQKGLKSQKIIY